MEYPHDRGTIDYPPAPWRLYGQAIGLPQLIAISEARKLVPPELSIIPLWPGFTLGWVCLATYGEGSTLTYDELLVSPALVRRGRYAGAWISHIWVDDRASKAGGREIWGLPKEMAQFTWQASTGRRVTVAQGEEILCVLQIDEPGWRFPWPFFLSTFGGQGSLRWFSAGGVGNTGLSSARVIIPERGRLPTILAGSRMAIHCDDLRATIREPSFLHE